MALPMDENISRKNLTSLFLYGSKEIMFLDLNAPVNRSDSNSKKRKLSDHTDEELNQLNKNFVKVREYRDIIHVGWRNQKSNVNGKSELVSR
jgi:hypothetical protein